MESDRTNEEFGIEQRLGAALTGIFLMCFGMPFTLVPAMILPDVFSFSGDLFLTVFLFCFTIPFFLAGLAVQYAGFKALRVALFPNSKKAREAFGNWNSDSQHSAPDSLESKLDYLSSESLAGTQWDAKSRKEQDQPRSTRASKTKHQLLG